RVARTAPIVIAIVLAAASCSKSSSDNSGNPAGPSGGGTTCWTYPTAATVTTTALGISITAQLTGTFNTATNTATITTNANGALSATSVSSYRSTADFVDEVKVIPGLTLASSITTNNAGGCGGSGTATVTYAYDSQRRVTSATNSLGATTTY